MAVYDLWTWNPVASSGLTPYDIPGGTNLAGTQDPDGAIAIKAGDASGLPALPTIPSDAQVNAATHFNQVAAAYNQRALKCNAAFGTSLATFNYLTAGNKPSAGSYTTLLSNINTLRTAEGFIGGALAFPMVTPVSRQDIRGYHLAFLRKALAVSGNLELPIRFSQSGAIFIYNSAAADLADGRSYVRNDSAYPTTIASEVFGSGVSTASFDTASTFVALSINIGKLANNSGNKVKRFRLLYHFNLPYWLASAPASVDLKYWLSGVDTTLESFTSIDSYLSNTDDSSPSLTPAGAGSAYNTNNLLQSWARTGVVGSAYNAFISGLASSALSARFGARASLILGTDVEFAGGGVNTGAGASNSLSGVNTINNSTTRSSMSGRGFSNELAYMFFTF